MPTEPPFQKYIFICENKRSDGRSSCGEAGTRLVDLLKEVVKSECLGASIRICRSGCLDACEKGPNVLIEPDHALFHHVEDTDLPKILECLRLPDRQAGTPAKVS